MTTMTVGKLLVAGSACTIGLSLLGCDPEEYGKEKSSPGGTGSAVEAPLAPLKEAPEPGDEVAVLQTGKGKIVLMFYPDRAPKHVENFKDLVKKGFYDGTRFHRVIVGFMIQGGDPNSKDVKKADLWGTGGYLEGGTERNVTAEFTDVQHSRGVLSMARGNDPNSASSQFFIMHADYPSLNGQYSAFGKVVSGMDVVDQIVQTPVRDPEGGGVFATRAVILEKATIETWPLKQ